MFGRSRLSDLRSYQVFYNEKKLDVIEYRKVSGQWWIVAKGDNGETRCYHARDCRFYFVRRDKVKVLKKWDLVRNFLFKYSKATYIQNGGLKYVLQIEE